MTEILFRAKRKDNGQWVDGYYYKMNETTNAFSEDYEKHPVPVHHYILFEQMTDWGLPNRMIQVEVDPDTLCRYTGENDTDNKKIWEHDFVAFTDTYSTENGYAEIECMGKVLWDDEEMCFSVTGRMSCESYEALSECAVVGNTFDNTEWRTGNE